MIQSALNLITCELVPEDQRMTVAERLFGIHFPLKLEPVIYGITDRMAEDYNGGYWDFYTLSNGGFYMALASDENFEVACLNQYKGTLSAMLLESRLVCTPTATSRSRTAGSPAYVPVITTGCGNYMFEHPEVKQILGAID